jgi:hypothetical protein
MTSIENLQTGQTVTLLSGITGRVETVSQPLPGSTLRELVIVDERGDLMAAYLGRVGDELAAS